MRFVKNLGKALSHLAPPRKRGGKNAVRSEGLSSFCNDCGDGNIRCNGRGKTSPLRKASGIVRMRNRISTHRRSPYEKNNVIVRMPNHISTLTLVLRKIIQYNKTRRRDVNSSRRASFVMVYLIKYSPTFQSGNRL